MSLSWINISHHLPFGLLRRMAGVNPLIVNYHVVSDRRLPHIINLYKYRDTKTFREDLDFLTSHFHSIDLHTLLDHLRNRTKLPKNSFLLTFDDGFKEVYEVVAPILIEKGIHATFFLTRDFIDNLSLGYDAKKSLIIDKILSDESVPDKLKGMLDFTCPEELVHAVFNLSYVNRTLLDLIAGTLNLDFSEYLENVSPYLSGDQISKLIHQGFTIGSHSLDHANFRELMLEDQLHQVMTSMDYLCKRFSLQYRVFAFPYTDIGISRDFFHKIENSIDASFGTQGLLTDCIWNNLQRISFEKFTRPAISVTKFYYSRRLFYRLIKNNRIFRK